MSKKTNLSVVIPAYNEIKNLGRGVLRDVYKYLSAQKYSWEIVLVDDGSSDGTLKVLRDFAKKNKNVRVLKNMHAGKAEAVISGILASKGEVALFSDMDQATPINQIDKLLPKFNEGYDLAIGSRVGRKGSPFSRKVMAYGFMLLRTLVLRLPYKDTQCGFKAFKKSAAEKIFSRMKVFRKGQIAKGSSVKAGFDLEILYIARKLDLKVAEVKVEWRNAGERGGSGVSPLKDSWEGFRDLMRVRLNAFLGKYNVA